MSDNLTFSGTLHFAIESKRYGCARCPNDHGRLFQALDTAWAGELLCRDCRDVVGAAWGCPHGAKASACIHCKHVRQARSQARVQMRKAAA